MKKELNNPLQIKKLIQELINIQKEFRNKFGVKDIYSNSKFFEI